MKAEKIKKSSYTVEYKLEVLRLNQGGKSCAALARMLGMPGQTLPVWICGMDYLVYFQPLYNQPFIAIFRSVSSCLARRIGNCCGHSS